jgi:hypothetical protein
MRGWIVPALAAVMVAGCNPAQEPSEYQMRLAFEGSLAAQVRNALEFAREMGGDEAVTKIRENGMDRYVVNAFHKLNCRAQHDGAAHVCAFSVDVRLVNGPLQTTITGRFSKSDNGFEFRGDV